MQRSNRNGLIVTLPAGTQVDGIVPASAKHRKPKVEAPPLETTEDQADCKSAEVEREAMEQAARAEAAAMMEKALEADALAHTEQEAALKERLSIEEASKRQTSDDTPPTPDDDGEFA